MDLRIISERYKSTHTTDYDLTIRLKPDGFSFCIAHNGSILALVDRSTDDIFRLQSELSSDPLLRGVLNSVEWLLPPTRDILIPKSLFNPLFIGDFAAKAFGGVQTDTEYLSSEIKALDAVHLYCVNASERAFLNDIFPGLRIRHPHTKWLENAISRKDRNIVFHADWLENVLTIAAVKKKELLFYNRFEAEDENTVLYYLSATAQSIRTESRRLILYNKSAVPEILSQYYDITLINPQLPGYGSVDLYTFVHLTSKYQ